MDKKSIISLYNRDQRFQVEYPDMRRDVLPGLVRHVNVWGGGEGTIIYSDLSDETAARAIRAQVDYFESLGQDFEWKVYDYDNPPDLKDRLAAFGFEVLESEAILVLAVDDVPELLQRPVTHRVVPVTDRQGLQLVRKIEEDVWGEDKTALFDYLAGCLDRIPDLTSIYVVYWEDEPAACGWVYFPNESRFASLWGGSTLEAHRGKGLYTALLAVRIQEARSRGVSYLTVDASSMSRPILERYGFVEIARAYACKWKVGLNRG